MADFKKIASGVLVAVVVAGFSGFLSDKLVVAAEPEIKAVKVAEAAPAPAAAAATATAPAAPAAEAPKGPEPVDALLAAASVENGTKLSKVCTACHTFDKGGPNRVGPNLFGIVGAKQASHEGFAYSTAFKGLKGTWTVEEINKYVFNPKAYAPGNKMAYAGMAKTQDRADLIAYLKSLK